MLGNCIFGAPNDGLAGWEFGASSLWVWQMLWWALGVVMLWVLAYKFDFSTAPAQAIPEMERERRF